MVIIAQFTSVFMPLDQLHSDDASMSFGDHLDELRRRVLLAVIPPLPLAIVIFVFSKELIDILALPLRRALVAADQSPQLQALSPPEMLIVEMKLSIILALVIAAPWILYQFWQFIRPGLYTHERRFVYFLLPGSAILTAAGVALLYLIMLPLVLMVLVGLGTGPKDTIIDQSPPGETVQPRRATAPSLPLMDDRPPPGEIQEGDGWINLSRQRVEFAVPDSQGRLHIVGMALTGATLVAQTYRLSEYINFVLLLLLAMVIAFQMPLVILLLGWLDIVTVQWLKSYRKHAVLICAGVSMFITPADAVSMIAMLIPLYLLFELGIILLMIAPAAKVAEGGVLRSDKSDQQE